MLSWVEEAGLAARGSDICRASLVVVELQASKLQARGSAQGFSLFQKMVPIALGLSKHGCPKP